MTQERIPAVRLSELALLAWAVIDGKELRQEIAAALRQAASDAEARESPPSRLVKDPGDPRGVCFVEAPSAMGEAEWRVIAAAKAVVAADTYKHPVLSREDAVKAGVAELHDAVNPHLPQRPSREQR